MHLIRRGCAEPPSPQGEGFFILKKKLINEAVSFLYRQLFPRKRRSVVKIGYAKKSPERFQNSAEGSGVFLFQIIRETSPVTI